MNDGYYGINHVSCNSGRTETTVTPTMTVTTTMVISFSHMVSGILQVRTGEVVMQRKASTKLTKGAN